MAAPYADYTYYTGSFHGTAIAEADFDRLAIHASAVIDHITYNRAAPVVEAETDTATIDKIKMATCAVAEEAQKLEASGGAVSQERIGNYQVTYLSQSSEGTRLAKAAKLYLWSTGLMYQGFADDEL